MLNKKQFKTEFAGQPLSIEVSDVAGQATASAIGRHGETVVLVTAVMSDQESDRDFFPLVVDYEERFYAVGKILGSRFLRREGRPSEEAILSGRLIDRTVRPLFDHRMRNQVQVAVTILQADNENDLDFITLLTTSAVLGMSKIPWGGPVAGVKLFYNGKDLKINPTFSQIKAEWPAEGGFISFVAGTDDRISMIELEGIDADETDVTEAYVKAQKEIAGLIKWQKDIIKEVGAPKVVLHLAESDESLIKMVKHFLKDKLEEVMYGIKDKQERATKLNELREVLKGHLLAEGVEEKSLGTVAHLFEEEVNDLVHRKVIEEEKRPDGRKLDEVRPLYGEVALLKRAHGSALFVRGNTQALVVTTLAAPGAEQLVETIEFSGKRRFLLHYNFPPYSVGEVGRMGAPGRREIGHGALAEKALRNIIPPVEAFPYTIRVVSEILSSNGSSSMATVCGGSMSLMDAGVPIAKPIAGIAMGLMVESKSPSANRQAKYKVLTDIQGPEDHHGDMDFKVAGSRDGVRAIQMDVKIDGVTNKMLIDGLAQAKKARLEILAAMEKAIANPRPEISSYAPMVLTINIHPSKIGEVIGPGGKVINGIIESTGAESIDIEEDGKVYIAGVDRKSAEAALRAVEAIVKEYQPGDVVEGEVVRIMDFGAIVEFGPGRDGMIHVSELKDGFVKKVEDVVRLGQRVTAKIIRVENGKIGLSLKGVQQLK